MTSLCNVFTPGPDPVWCMCRVYWNHHSPHAKQAFITQGDQHLITSVFDALKRDTENPCPGYEPASDWVAGHGAPDCICGRIRTSHPSKDVIAGMNKYREKHGIKKKGAQPCGQHIGSITTPGVCSVCHFRWIDHPLDARPLVVEAFTDLHKAFCKCVIMNGENECDCMLDTEKQAALDKIAEPTKVACKSFKPKSTGHTHCTCSKQFHEHAPAARAGFNTFITWRAAHLSNDELIAWFLSLPGTDRGEKTRFLEKLLADPNIKYTPPSNMVMPDSTTLVALLETLDGGAVHRIRRPKDAVEALVIVPEEVKKYFCHWCSEMESTTPGSACITCAEFLAKNGADPMGSPVKKNEHQFNDEASLGGS